jgi:hypothetical protein
MPRGDNNSDVHLLRTSQAYYCAGSWVLADGGKFVGEFQVETLVGQGSSRAEHILPAPISSAAFRYDHLA